MLTPEQQAAMNALTNTTLLLETAEQDARDIERDGLSRTLPRGAQAVRRKMCRAALAVQEALHNRARSRVLCLHVPTGDTYRTYDSSGNEYKAFLSQGYTLNVMLHRVADTATPVDTAARNRRAALEEVADMLAPHGLTLHHTEGDDRRAFLLDEQRRFLGTARVRDDGHVDLITEGGPVPLTFDEFNGRSRTTERHCNPQTVARARSGEFRPA